MKETNRGIQAFTLIELLVVIAIIGILSSVIFASLSDSRVKAKDIRRVADLEAIQTALEIYFSSYQEYPDSVSDLVLGEAIPVEPIDPKDSISYLYVPLTDSDGATCAGSVCGYYHLGANLEQQGSSLLSGDNNRCPTTIPSECTTLTGTTINGENADGCGNEVGRYCYDVTP